MKKFSLISAFVLLMASSFVCKSCMEDKHMDIPDDPWTGESAEISFLVDMPKATQVATRALGSETENAVEEVHILVFDKTSGALVYKSKGKSMDVVSGSPNDNKISFRATLPVGKEFTFMVLANAEGLLSGIEVGMSKNKSHVEAIVKSLNDKWKPSTEAIPMWGEKDINLTASDTPSFELTRMLAKIDVEVNLRDISPGVPADNFKLTSVRYYNYNTSGALVPAGNYDITTKKVLTPTIPASPGTKIGEALVYKDADITDYKSCKEKIYVFEALHNGSVYKNPPGNKKWVDNPCLVIGGSYKTKDGEWLKETFYRIDFIRKDSSDPQNVKDQWLSILRNFSYNVTIAEVSGSGYEDEDTALNSVPINMEASILDWNERDMGEIVFDGVFYLSVSQDEYAFQRGKVDTKKEENILYVKTDYLYKNDPLDTQSGWRVEKYTDENGVKLENPWLKLNPEKGEPDELTEAYFTFEENKDPDNRQAVVWIAAGRLRYPVYITQRVLSLDILDPQNGNLPIDRIEFEVPKKGDFIHPEREFTVNWTPVSKVVKIEPDPLLDNTPNPFQPDWLAPDPKDELNWQISAGTGIQAFRVNPTTVPPSELERDPFYEKETTYYFSVENGSGEESDIERKGVTIRQIHYNIIVDRYSYKLDGKTYTVSVRSNTDWKISNIEEWLYNVDPKTLPANERPSAPVLLQPRTYDNLKIGATGGFDINGQSLGFTVVNEEEIAHRKKWGTVYVTFESLSNKFDTFTVPLNFPPSNFTIMGLGYANVDGAWNVCQSNGRHQNGIYHLLNFQKNFGDLEDSKVRVKDLRLVGFHAESTGADATNGQWSPRKMKEWINEYKPDVIVLTYSILLNKVASELLVEYMDNGGTVLAFLGGQHTTGYAQNLLREVFGQSNLTASRQAGTGDVYLFGGTQGADDEWKDNPLVNGPFGDLRGLHWGSHYANEGFNPSPEQREKINVITYGRDCVYGAPTGKADYVVAFTHKEYKFFWCGNDSFMGSYYPALIYGGVSYEWPCQLDRNYDPIPRTGFGRTAGTKYSVYNSAFMGNLFAWAIQNANYMHPDGGYK